MFSLFDGWILIRKIERESMMQKLATSTEHGTTDLRVDSRLARILFEMQDIALNSEHGPKED